MSLLSSVPTPVVLSSWSTEEDGVNSHVPSWFTVSEPVLVLTFTSVPFVNTTVWSAPFTSLYVNS